jgi:protein-L-isoaspartate(D-aspartate) O-methyltransferase
MRYISAPQRSQRVGASGAGDGAAVLSGVIARAPFAVAPGGAEDDSAMRANYGMAGQPKPTLSDDVQPPLLQRSAGQPSRDVMSDGWIDEQLIARGITDARVLDAMRRVPREAFMPESARRDAYADRAQPIGAGQTISQPYMVAAMTEALRLTGAERVLDVGTGSGYQAAVLAGLAREVITIERVPELAETARARLARLGYANVIVVVGDGTLGVPAHAPFDGILVAAGAPRAPATLKAQLSGDGGRLVIPIGPAEQQWLTVIVRSGDVFAEAIGIGCVFVPLLGQEGW